MSSARTDTYQPWQFGWKRPQLEEVAVPGSSESSSRLPDMPPQSSSSSTPPHLVDHIAAVVSPHEVSEALRDTLPDGVDSSSTLVLTVSILSSVGVQANATIPIQTNADVVLVELTQQTSPPEEDVDVKSLDASSCKVLLSRKLQWPQSALLALETNNTSDDPSRAEGDSPESTTQASPFAWMRRRGRGRRRSPTSRTGLVSVSFVRCSGISSTDLPNKNNPMDALDILHLLSLEQQSERGLSNTQQEWLQTLLSAKQRQDSITPNDLQLACLSSEGVLYFYDPIRLLSGIRLNKKAKNEDWEHGMERLLLGEQMLATMKMSILPLSEPVSRVVLSIPQRRKRDSSHLFDAESISLTQDLEEPSHSTDPLSVWNASLWDPTVDAASLPFSTRDNTPSLTVAVLDFLCVAGTGHRLRPDATPVDSSSSQSRPFSSASTMMSSSLVGSGDGGFVTFVSARTYVETRTVFLPYPPIRISPFAWNGMTFLLVLGSAHALAIRVDSSSIGTVTAGSAPSPFANSATVEELTTSSEVTAAPTTPKPVEISIRRFQMLPIQLPQFNTVIPMMVGSSVSTSPPSIALAFVEEHSQYISVVRESLQCVNHIAASEVDAMYAPYETLEGTQAVIQSGNDARDVARISLLEEPHGPFWFHLNQGWGVLGACGRLYFVCWDGGVEMHGAYVQELDATTEEWNECSVATVISLESFSIPAESSLSDLRLPYSGSLEKRVSFQQPNLKVSDMSSTYENCMLDQIVAQALESISSYSFRQNVVSQSPPRSPRRKARSFTGKEKSDRLLRQCSSWVQLDDSQSKRLLFQGRSPVLDIRLRFTKLQRCMLSLRKAAQENGATVPFQRILSWLSDQGDFFTAASLALDLLRNTQSLSHLWRTFDRLDDENDRSMLDGLLDGILPLHNSDEHTNLNPAIMTQLADMTVGCLAKGGFAMASTLEGFLQNDRHYDPNRACLMAVATTACTVSDDRDVVLAAMGKDFEKANLNIENILWPVRCLMKVGTTRDCLGTALILLNSTIPDELRRRNRTSSATTSIPSMELCKALVTQVIISDPSAGEILLALVDEESRMPFWMSLDHETRQALALLKIETTFPLLRFDEVRSWALAQFQLCLEEEGSSIGSNRYSNPMSTTWLQDLCMACMINGGCPTKDVEGCDCFDMEQSMPDPDELYLFAYVLKKTRGALTSLNGSGGLDFNLLIPCLLILEQREELWQPSSAASTQHMLNAACYLSGRRNVEEPLFVLDGPSLMRQCTLAENIQAGANLLGGKNGLILECCDILLSCTGMKMEAAEAFLVSPKMKDDEVSAREETADFVVTDEHRRILSCLSEHTLSIRTYGEFETTHLRGRVDPVFAATVCLRTWWVLTRDDINHATVWLESWLRQQLGMKPGQKSPHRLASAALSRALIWPPASEPDGHVLAARLQVSRLFLLQLVQSCCGLAEAIPTHVAEELVERSQPDFDTSMRTAMQVNLDTSIDETFASATSSLPSST